VNAGCTALAGSGFVFDVTDVLKKLESAGVLGDSVTVSIVPAGKPRERVKALVGEVSLIEQ
jgi:hypothetical protein